MPTALITSMSFEKSSEEPKNETAGVTRRDFLKGAATLVGSAMLGPEIVSADSNKETESLNEGEPGPEYMRGMQELHEKAKTEKNEFFGVYREQDGAGAWNVTEEEKTSGLINFGEIQNFLGDSPSHAHLVHTHPEQYTGKGWSPPSLLDIQAVVALRYAFEGKNGDITHQVVDGTGIWTFELDPASKFAVAMRYLQMKTPDVIEALMHDAATSQFAKEGEDPRITGMEMLDNMDKFKSSTRRKVRKLEGLEETLLGDFNLGDFDVQVVNRARLSESGEQERMGDLKEHYKKLGVTLSYEPFAGAASVSEAQQ